MVQTQAIATENRPVANHRLDVAQLKTVKWITTTYPLELTIGIYMRLHGFTLIRWMLAPTELMFISFYLIVHKLPWPGLFLNILFRIDTLAEKILDAVGGKFEWWLDNVLIRFMWFRESVESSIDTILSIVVFVTYQAFDVWLWSLLMTKKMTLFWMSPIVWIVERIPSKGKLRNSTTTLPGIRVTDFAKVEDTQESERSLENNDLALRKRDRETEEDGRRSNHSSEYESDVSLVSESKSIGQSNQGGKYYNRVEMKAIAEGKLRAAMYKRVKHQLYLMRKNSVVFSRGMAAYARSIIEPKVEPLLIRLLPWLQTISKKYNLRERYDATLKWVQNHPFASRILNSSLWILNKPNEILNRLLGEKRKSRRSRSMRSESLRRKAPLATNVVADPIGLGKSAEPVQEEGFCELQEIKEIALKEDNDSENGMRDSALASSVDDLCPTSDSNEGSHALTEQPIVEEEEEKNRDGDDNLTKVKNAINSRHNRSNRTKGGRPKFNKIENGKSEIKKGPRDLEFPRGNEGPREEEENSDKSITDESTESPKEELAKRRISFTL